VGLANARRVVRQIEHSAQPLGLAVMPQRHCPVCRSGSGDRCGALQRRAAADPPRAPAVSAQRGVCLA
jgi:hypothetical protein